MKAFNLKNKSISLKDAYKAAEVHLKEAGADDPDVDAMQLLLKVTGFSRNEYFMRREEKLPAEQSDEFCEMISKRGERIPLQHITGEAFFYGRRFIVNENVLIPRMDTEILVAEVLKDIKSGMSVLDLCTGSGCIAVSIAKEADAAVSASDISEKALETAKKNSELNGADCFFIKSDMFDNIEGVFDIIVSNPPYIVRGEIDSLQEEVKNHDPRSALDGGEDGLDFYRIIARESRKHLKSDGRIYLEIGADQSADVSKLLEDSGFCDVGTVFDLNGLPRVVKGKITGAV